MRQRMLHALEALSRAMTASGRYGEAVEAAMMAIGVEPLRERARSAPFCKLIWRSRILSRHAVTSSHTGTWCGVN